MRASNNGHGDFPSLCALMDLLVLERMQCVSMEKLLGKLESCFVMQ